MNDRIAQINASLIGRYVIERELGAGGMATVYLADDVKHRRKVAIKVLRDDLSASVGAARFQREIEIAAQLQHPSILPLLDSGEADGLLYFVMPFVQGQSLRHRLNRERELPISDAVRLLIEIVDGLAHAHEHGVVHRDIKPDNVMLSGRHALITDFGVARAVSEATNADTLTTMGVALGTPSYMSPEQATADPAIDHRADIYALGIVAYELLSGRLPFSGTPQQVLAAHVTEAPDPVQKHRPGISPALSSAVMRCLAKLPADRWQTAGELLAALEPLATPSGGLAPTSARLEAVARPPSRRRKYLVAAGVVGLLVVAAAAVAFTSLRKVSPSIAFGRATQLTNESGLQISPAISPDGKLVAFAAGNSARARIFIRPVSGGRSIPLTDDSTQLEFEPQWSPDGSQVLFRTLSGVSVAPALGGHARALIANMLNDTVSTASWSPDGREIVYARRDSVFAGGADGQTHRLLATGAFQANECRWSRHVSLIACTSGNSMARDPGANFANKAPSGIVIIPAAGGRLVQVTNDHAMNQSPEWSPSSDRLFFISNRDGPLDVYEVAVASNGTPRSTPMRLTTGLNARSISVTGDSRHVAYSLYAGHANIYSLAIPASGVALSTDATPVTSGPQIIEAVRVSPDGKWVTYDSDHDGIANIYRVPAAGGDPEQLTNDPFDEFAPDLSPDDKLLAYHSFRNGTRDIEVKPLDGEPVELVTSSKAQESYPIWAPDGKRLTFIDQGGFGAFVTTRLAPGKWSVPRQLYFGGAPFVPQTASSTWSPDGKWLVSVADRALVLIAADSGPGRTVYTAPPGEPVPETGIFSKDGRSIYFKSHDSMGRAMFSVVPATGGTPRVIVRFPDLSRPSSRQGFGMSATRFYFPVEDRQSNIWLADLA
ncbi:MAG TPA: protein kinase, partial [Gemmatimonadaceae bacterium]|nr:protein kinase [Gemmatimonadaceae bacterium]